MKLIKEIISILIIGIILGCQNVEAHVTLNPNTSAPGAYDEYQVRVPVERDVPTVKLELEVPDGVALSSVAPVPGFKHTFEMDKQDNIKKVTWEATGKGIGAHEHVNFPIVVANPEKEGKFVWKAIQTYKDGKQVKWTDANEDSEHPAPVSEVKQGGGTTAGHSHHEQHGAHHTASEGTHPAIWIMSILALIMSFVAVFKRYKQSQNDK
ncbi:YcnI family protein [Staphylococcus agnetis]|uniref:YcnI family protein n=1 Tax=Staphylococcus agnetis TaxID=985762 RepID=A0ABD7TUS1_9STAP|nr:YcnI family protein [Staphylococcus agnetis]UXU55429.1 YcnI family protein [Staphylococcus agnetis]UXU57709.1 YcnI family protein [Staphylococcus agnetis]UXU64681.1 YcnI family protein [Staphylococcus agnetis]UXU67022.1 YcnI family protein [Staphylococcus agnetis]